MLGLWKQNQQIQFFFSRSSQTPGSPFEKAMTVYLNLIAIAKAVIRIDSVNTTSSWRCDMGSSSGPEGSETVMDFSGALAIGESIFFNLKKYLKTGF